MSEVRVPVPQAAIDAAASALSAFSSMPLLEDYEAAEEMLCAAWPHIHAAFQGASEDKKEKTTSSPSVVPPGEERNV